MGSKQERKGDMNAKLDAFLFKYRTTEHANTGASPASFVFKRTLLTQLDLLRPPVLRPERDEELEILEVSKGSLVWAIFYAGRTT